MKEEAGRRKLQVSNGYLLDFDQISRVLNTVAQMGKRGRIPRSEIMSETGLPDRSVEALVSMAAAMGVLRPATQTLTPYGALIAEHDMFFERQGTLEWCHYRGAGSVRNLVWFDVFNRLLPEEEPMTHSDWNGWFRTELAGQYSDRTLRKVVQEEVRFVINAYMEQKLKTLGILEPAEGDAIGARPYRQIDHLVFAAMLYDFMTSRGATTFEIEELCRTPGSPTVVFLVNPASVRDLAESLHTEGLIRYERMHNLDQIRLIPGYAPLEFLRAYYEERRPSASDTSGVTDG